MYRKRTRIIFLIVLTISLITACSPATLSDINCQADDVDSEPPFIRLSEDAIKASNIPYPDQLADYSRVALSENQLTVTDVLCTSRVYESVTVATSALNILCAQSIGDKTEESYGDAACGIQNEGIGEIHFRQGDTVVTIREDAGGTHVAQWAEAVLGRLNK